LGRIYVKQDKDAVAPLDYDSWVAGVRDGRSYVSDGLSHLFDFEVNGLGVGEPGDGGRASVLAAKSGDKLQVKVKAAALLDETPHEAIRRTPLSEKPYWHVERARVDNSRQVPVELVVNGQSVERKLIDADGDIEDVEFEYTPDRSSWVALRIYPSSHTNPVFVEVDGKPIRASKKSAQWCLDSVEACWKGKVDNIRESERPAARAAFDVAKEAYQKVLAEAAED
jgi:hypothetical protein